VYCFGTWYKNSCCNLPSFSGDIPQGHSPKSLLLEVIFGHLMCVVLCEHESSSDSLLLQCKEKAECLQDPLPLNQMYAVITPSTNSPHGLNECLSRRGESSLDSFHLTLAHFGNCGMRTSLAGNLNLTGTARYNLAIRHKLRLSRTLTTQNTKLRSKIPVAFETIVCFPNQLN